MFTTLATAALCMAASVNEVPFERIDYNGDGRVNSMELTIMLNAWGLPQNGSEQRAWCDITGDGVINYDDLVYILSNYTG